MKTKTFGITRAVSVLLALIAALAAALSCLSVNAKALEMESVRKGTVAVVFCLKNAYVRYVDPSTKEVVAQESIGNELLLSHGSGFFVGKKGEKPQYIVTNHHVVSDYVDANEGSESYIYVGTTKDGYWAFYYGSSCEMRIYYDEKNYDVAYVDCYGDMNKIDLAVLKLREPTDKRTSLAIAPVSDSDVGNTVYTVGYPGNADNDFTNASKYGINDSSVHKGSVVRIAMNDKGVERISIDATIQHGNSGGPLVNENGQVIGVNTNVESNSPFSDQIEADYYSISSKTLMEFLDKNSIPYEKGTATKKGLNPVVIILIAAGAVVIIGGVAALVIVNNKKKSAPAQANNSRAVPNAPQAAPSQPANFAQAVVVCERGALAGRTFAIGSGVLIGRNPQKCGICFPVDTKGVSGVHCEIRPSKNGGFEIIDRGSSNGTTLGNGQKLSPNVPVYIASGTYVSLGSMEQMIQVRY